MATTANMGLILPDVSVTPGPTYANQNNTAFTTVDSHDHTTGKGVQIPSSGININDTLEMNSQTLSETKSIQFDNQASLLTDNRIIQVQGGELYFNDASGNQVQITNGGSLDITSSGGIGGDYTSAGAAVTFTDATNTYLFVNGSAVQSLLDFKGYSNGGRVIEGTTDITTNTTITTTDDNFILLVDTTAARTITLPDPTTAQRVITIKDISGQAATNNITLARAASENIEGAAASYTLDKNFGLWKVVSDLTDWWIISEKPQVESFAEIQGPSTAGTTNIPNTFASPTLTAPVNTFGTPITVSSNTITFPFQGLWRIGFHFSRLQSDNTGDRQVMFRLRNTTDASTVEVSTTAVGIQSTIDGQHTYMEVFAQITEADKADDYEVQWVASGSVDARVTNNTIDGETGYRWRIVFEKVGE